MLLKRVLTAFILIPLLVASVLYLSPKQFSVLLALVAFVCGFEFSLMFFGAGSIRSYFLPFLVGGAVYAICTRGSSYFLPLLILSFFFFLFYSILLPDTPRESGRWFAFSLLGFVYIALLLPYFQFLRELDGGAHLIFSVAVTVYVGDTAAYFAGSRFGRTKLAPAISPGKTWEGAIASALFGTAAGCIYLTAFGLVDGRLKAILIAFVVSTVGQFGDLFESLLKRVAGVKDSGSIFPGHGGMLDRIDSFIVNGVVLYFLMKGF